MFDDYFERASDLTRRGVPFATATVVRAEKPTSGKPGDRAIVTLDGVMSGWIGGSCAQPTVIREARQALLEDQSRLVRLSTRATDGATVEGVVERPMTCFSGGTLEIFIEPHAPRPRLLIVGHLPVAQALAHLGKAMNYHVIAVIPQEDAAAGDNMAAMAHADQVLSDFSQLAAHVTPLTFAVVASHGHYDQQALQHVLATPVPYVGLVASRKRAQAVIDDLQSAGLDATTLARLEAPAGLDIGARRGDEIALSIMAEVIQTRRAVERFAWSADADCCSADSGIADGGIADGGIADSGIPDAAMTPQATDLDGTPVRPIEAVVATSCCSSQATEALTEETPEVATETPKAAAGGCCGGGA